MKYIIKTKNKDSLKPSTKRYEDIKGKTKYTAELVMLNTDLCSLRREIKI